MHQIPELAKQLAYVNVPVFPCWDNKQPAIQEGFKGASTTLGTFWPSHLLGLGIPDGVTLFDLDKYKGMSTQSIDMMLGCSLDWEAAHIQNTPRGGGHYAFRTTERIRQGTDLFKDAIGKGFDIRSPGRGYICTGEGYNQVGELGVLALSVPDNLPMLPPQAVQILCVQIDQLNEPRPLPTGDRNADEITKMLKCIDADCSRDEWLKVGLALKHHYHDDDATGWLLFDNWSMSSPEAYEEHEASKLWNTIKPSGEGKHTTTLGTLVHKAIENGYIPGKSAEEVFGGSQYESVQDQSVDIVSMEQMVVSINELGGSPEHIDQLVTQIRTLVCSDIQRAALTATLERVLRNNDLKISNKDLKNATNTKTSTPIIYYHPTDTCKFNDIKIPSIMGLSNVHIKNATMLMTTVFTNRLVRFGIEVYWWNGKEWEYVTKSDLTAQIAKAFIDNQEGKDGVINGTRNQLINIIARVKEFNPPSTYIFFNNGVFDPHQVNPLSAHDSSNFNTSTLSVDYTPDQPRPHWDKFLTDIFNKEPQRITLLQEIMGWWLINDNLNHQKAVALDGVGRSGKGSILMLIGAILGPRGMADVSIAQLADNKVIANLRNVNLGVDRDAKRPASKDISTVHSQFNKITANEPISVPLLYSQEIWNGSLNCKLAVACNGIPIIADDSGAAPNRWIILKFTESFLGREDLELPKKLLSEKSAIAAWAVEGLIRLMQNGCFTLPESSIEESHAVLESSSPLIQFAEEWLVIEPESSVHGSILWDKFKQWCSATNNRLPYRQQFLRSLERSLQSQGVRHKKCVRVNGTIKAGLEGVRIKTFEGGNVTSMKPTAAEAFQENSNNT